MKAIYHRDLRTYATPHIVRHPNGRKIVAKCYIKSIVSVDNGKTWWYLGEDTDYPCDSYQSALIELNKFFWQDLEINYEMNPVIWENLKKEKVSNPFELIKIERR